MKTAKVSAVFSCLSAGEGPVMVFAVQGGTFSEGVDYPGESVIGAFVVGPPLPNYDLEREEMRKYYEERYQAGFDFAYVIPAMSKAVQAAGRVIRSESDRGLIVLMDGRFVQPAYSRAMPSDWFEKSPTEMVSDSILQDVAEFWLRSRSCFCYTGMEQRVKASLQTCITQRGVIRDLSAITPDVIFLFEKLAVHALYFA
jgi:DNA excision repair protein ERCC-2